MLKLRASWLWLLYLIPLSNAFPARNAAAAVVSVPAASTTTPVPELLKPRQVAFTQETRTITGWILRFATASVTATTIVTVRSTDIAVKTSYETFTAAAQSTSTVATTTITKTVSPAAARSATEVPATPVGGAPRLNARQATTITTYVSTVEVTEYTTTTSFVTVATVTSTDLELFTSSSTATQIWLDTSLLKLVTATETVTATAAPGAGQGAGGGGGLSTGAQIGLGVAVGVLALILLAIGAWFLIRRRRKRRDAALASSAQQSPHANGGHKSAAGSQPPGSPWTVDSQARPPSELHSQSTGTAAPRVWSGQSWSTATAVGGGWGDQRESVHGFQQQSPHDGQWHPSVRGTSPPMSENGFVAGGGNGHWHNGHGGHDGVQGPAELVDQPKLHELSAK